MARNIATVSLVLAFSIAAHASSLDFVVTGARYGTVLSDNSAEFVEGTSGYFRFEVWVDPSPDQYFKGLSLFLTESTSAGLHVAGRTITGVGPWYYVVDPTVPNGFLFGDKVSYREYSMLNPTTADLGATTRVFNYGDEAGQVMSLDLAIPADLTAGTVLTITPAGSTYVKNDNSAGDFDHYDELIVNIVPEPVTLALLALGGIALIRRR